MESYNSRLIQYSTEQQITFYSKTITKGKKKKELNEHFTKAYKNDKRTKEQEEHCKNISINKTKNKIYQLARANTWEWFITLTFDRKKNDASDYQVVVDNLKRFIDNLRKNYCPDLIYLIVPELHADGEHYHFHGLLANTGDLQFIYSGKIDKKNRPVFNIKQWRIGFTTATRVSDTARVSGYITKYITKECCSVLKNKKRYYASHNIEKPNIIYGVLSEAEFLEMYADKIKYCKTVKIKEANMKVSYFELDYFAED